MADDKIFYRERASIVDLKSSHRLTCDDRDTPACPLDR
jgi:hypothetical protein